MDSPADESPSREGMWQKTKENNVIGLRLYIIARCITMRSRNAPGDGRAGFIAQMVEEYIVGKPIERYSNGQKTHAWKAAVKGATV